MEQVTNGANGEICVCPRKKNDKSPAVFYADRVTIDGKTVMYSDVAKISIYGVSTTNDVVFETYSAYVKLTTKDGKKMKWKTGGSSFAGFGGKKLKQKKEYFYNIFEACMNTVVRSIAAEQLSVINNGGTVTIAGITIGAKEITGKHVLKKKTIPISEVGGCRVTGGNVFIYGPEREEDILFNGSVISLDNAVCLVPIVNSLVAANAPAAPQQ